MILVLTYWIGSTDSIWKSLTKRFGDFNQNLIAFSITFESISMGCPNCQIYQESLSITDNNGGSLSTIIPEYIIQKKFVDFVIQGEGEIPFTKLVECLEGAGNLY